MCINTSKNNFLTLADRRETSAKNYQPPIKDKYAADVIQFPGTKKTKKAVEEYTAFPIAPIIDKPLQTTLKNASTSATCRKSR